MAVPIPASGWPFGCTVEFGYRLVSIIGPSREAVFATASEILRESCRALPALSIVGRLYTLPPESRGDGRDWLHVSSGHGGVDTWQIIVGASVAFAPTSLDPFIPEIVPGLERQAPPALALVKRDQ